MCNHFRSKWTWERWQWRDTLHSTKLQHCWSSTIRLFNVISRTLVKGVLLLWRDAVSVFYCPSRLDCVYMCVIIYIYIYIYIRGAFKIKIKYIIAIHLMRWPTNFYDFTFKSTATAAIGIHPTKAWLSQLVKFKNAIWHFRRTICNKILF